MKTDTQCPICESTSLRERLEKLRDSDDIGVLECSDCAHVFLESFEHIADAYFERGEFMQNKPFTQSIEDRQRHYAEETNERAERVGPLIVNKRVLDFGCGAGALMERLAPLSKTIMGVEPTAVFQDWLKSRGLTVRATIEELEGEFDAILMFHVLEHLPDPVATLRELGAMLPPDGMIYIEVPNVRDALTTLYEVEAARRFLYFTDHLQYFSRKSLTETVKRAGLDLVWLAGHNRFGLANHLYWQSHGKPGGHKIWSFLETPSLAREYARTLAAADLSDSLIAQVRPRSQG